MSDIGHPGKALVATFYDAFTGRDLAAFDDILATGWINHPADPGRENNREGFKAGVVDFHAAFEGFRIRRDALVAEGDLVVCRITMSGRHVGVLGDWRPDGREVTFHGMDMHRIEQGRIAETWHFENMG